MSQLGKVMIVTWFCSDVQRHQLLKMDMASSPNFLEREAAYLAARERIFGIEELELKEATRQKPRHDPVVARRMIAHALGQRITQNSQVKDNDGGPSHRPTDVSDIERKIRVNLDLHQENSPDSSSYRDKNVRAFRGEASARDEKLSQRASDTKASSSSSRPGGRDALGVSKMRMREENLGAAKRIFAHALGIPASKEAAPIPRCREVKTSIPE
uniref:SUZ domain-containing protein n=1 Tax=Opuntia streptacantha TaxID=393608 RepID=A0A7C9EZV3_OPUST